MALKANTAPIFIPPKPPITVAAKTLNKKKMWIK